MHFLHICFNVKHLLPFQCYNKFSFHRSVYSHFKMSRRCVLRCTSDSHPDITLPDGVEILVGRSKITKIHDQNCSRQQISLKANYKESTVELKQLGVNPSGLDGFSMQRNTAYNVGHGSSIEILLTKYPHLVQFHPPPEGDQRLAAKRKLEDDNLVKTEKILILEAPSTSSKTGVATMENCWDNIDNGELYIFTSKGVKSSSKIAAYDMDGTIIKTRSGKVHPVDTFDWQIAYSEVHSKLKSLSGDGYKIVFLTNQAPIGKGRVKIDDFKRKLEGIVEKLGVPVQAFVATGRGMYRKPMTGMWDVLVEEKNDNISIDTGASFYCGDAAGRVNNWAPGKKKDHSMADRLLAENIGLKFYTPEEHFLEHPHNRVPFAKPDFNPKELETTQFNDKLISSEKEIVVLVGFPGSGKSFLAQRMEKESGGRYRAVCRDTLGSWQKCASEATKLLQAGKSVIVDSTNPDVESRARWTALARERGVPCRCARLRADIAHSRHNNKFRELLKIKHAQVTDMVFHSYKNKFKEPRMEEGFTEVLSVGFSPSFESEQSEKLYNMHLLEK